MNTTQPKDSRTHEADTPEVKLKRNWDGQSIDWWLQHLVQLSNELKDFNLPVTLTVGGSTVSGKLVGGKKYFEMFADQMVGSWEDGEAKESWRNGIAGIGERVYPEESAQDDGHPPNFIHLMDARVHHPTGNVPTNMGILWRGRINAVSGFWLGQLTPADDPEATAVETP